MSEEDAAESQSRDAERIAVLKERKIGSSKARLKDAALLVPQRRRQLPVRGRTLPPHGAAALQAARQARQREQLLSSLTSCMSAAVGWPGLRVEMWESHNPFVWTPQAASLTPTAAPQTRQPHRDGPRCAHDRDSTHRRWRPPRGRPPGRMPQTQSGRAPRCRRW